MKSTERTGTSEKVPKETRILWISWGYGFGPDLAYWAPLFREFTKRMPGTRVLVERDFPIANYADLPLLPILNFSSRTIRRAAGPTIYEEEIKTPKLSAFRAIFRLPADVYVLPEFTAVARIGLLVAKLKRKKTVILIESHPKYRGTAVGGLVEKVKGWLARRADVVLAGNEAARGYAEMSLGVKPNRLLIGPYITSAPRRQSGSELQAEPADADGVVRLLFLNSVTARKGIEQLILALGELDAAARTRFILDVVGGGDRMDVVRELVAQFGLESNVRFHDRRPYTGVGLAYQSADIIVCPTLADYRSLAGFEAVNSGKPVLISKFDGAHDELVAATRSAVSIDPLDTVGFAKRLEILLMDEAERKSLIALAANQIPPQFGISAAGANVERAVAGALRGI